MQKTLGLSCKLYLASLKPKFLTLHDLDDSYRMFCKGNITFYGGKSTFGLASGICILASNASVLLG
jgi:hypothetical protein